MSEDQFDERKFGQLLEWIYEVDQITDSEARSRLVEQIKSMPQDIVEKMYPKLHSKSRDLFGPSCPSLRRSRSK